MSVPEWLPDWQDKEAYPDPTKTLFSQFAWEFLRGNTEYQEDYKKHGLDKGHECSPSEEDCYICAQYFSQDFTFTFADQSIEFYESSLKWGVLALRPPELPGHPLFTNRDMPFAWVGQNPGKELEHHRPVFLNPREGEILAVFDARFSIPDQLSRVKALLEKEKKRLDIKKAVPKKDDLRIFLRILDGYASGQSAGEIQEFLFPEKEYPEFEKHLHLGKYVNELYKLAIEYRDWRYTRLPPLDYLKKGVHLHLNMPREIDLTEKLIESMRGLSPNF